MRSKAFNVMDMRCDGCAAKLTRALLAITGVSAVEVSLANCLVTVTYEEKRVDIAQLRIEINQLGYGIDDFAPARTLG